MRPFLFHRVLTTLAVGATALIAPLPALVATAPPAYASPVTTEGSLAEHELRDSFDGAVNNGPHYGLNSQLAARQQGTGAPVGYTRRSGYWSTTGSAISSSNQVNHGSYPGTMTFHLPASSTIRTTAVALDDPMVPSGQGFKVSATLSPLLNDDLAVTAEHAWTSMVLTQSATSTGYVAGADVELGVMVRSSGRVELYEEGAAIVPQGQANAWVDVLRAPTYDVSLTVSGSTATVDVTPVNALGQRLTTTTITATVGVPTDRRHHLLLGSYFAPTVTATSPVSSVDDLKVWRVASLQHSGHYFTRWDDDTLGTQDHLAEVDDHANFNWVQKPGHLAGCGYRDCVLEVRWQFFDGTRRLRSDYQASWDILVGNIGANHDRIAAFYVIDEPYWNPKTTQAGYFPPRNELETSISTIKADFPNIPVFTAYNRSVLVPRDASTDLQAGIDCPTGTIIVDCLGGIPTSLDWVGFASYRAIGATDGASVIAGRMPSRITSRQRLVLVPQSHRDSATYPVTDDTMAALQHEYLDLADDINDDYHANPTGYRSVVALLTFGRWTENAGLSIAKTVGEQYCTGHEVIDRQTMNFHDSFDVADNSVGYGLNDQTDVRQCKSTWTQTGTSFARRSGVWNTSTLPISSSNQVNHPSYQRRMSFHVGASAVMVNNNGFTPGNEGVRVSADLSPLVNDDGSTAENAWMSLLLSDSSTSDGWLNGADIGLGVQVRSSGRVQLVQGGNLVTPTGSSTTYVDVPRAATYQVEVALDGDDAVVTVNGTVIRADVGAAPPTPYYLYVGNYWSQSTYSSPVSTLDNLWVSTRKQ